VAVLYTKYLSHWSMRCIIISAFNPTLDISRKLFSCTFNMCLRFIQKKIIFCIDKRNYNQQNLFHVCLAGFVSGLVSMVLWCLRLRLGLKLNVLSPQLIGLLHPSRGALPLIGNSAYVFDLEKNAKVLKHLPSCKLLSMSYVCKGSCFLRIVLAPVILLPFTLTYKWLWHKTCGYGNGLVHKIQRFKLKKLGTKGFT